MKGKFLTQHQQERLAGTLTGLVVVLSEGGHAWTKQQADDLKVCFQAVGQPMPFSFEDTKPEVADKPGFFARARALLGQPS